MIVVLLLVVVLLTLLCRELRYVWLHLLEVLLRASHGSVHTLHRMDACSWVRGGVPQLRLLGESGIIHACLLQLRREMNNLALEHLLELTHLCDLLGLLPINQGEVLYFGSQVVVLGGMRFIQFIFKLLYADLL